MNTRPIINAHFDEARQSQLPLVELLINMGYTYLPRAEVLRERHEDTSKFILKDIAFEALRRINSYEHSGQMWKFEDEEIKKAIDELEAIKFVGLVDTSKEIYNTIMPTTGGKTIKVFHEGKSESKSFRFIDFAKPENNTFHVVVEFEATGKQNIRPDIVLFVNGIPFVIVENKKAGVDIAEAMTQHVRNQKADHCPRLYIYTQMLVATNGTDFRYGTTDTPAKFYVEWKEKDVNEIDRYTTNKEIDEKLKPYIEKKIDKNMYQLLLSDLNGYTTGHIQKIKRKISVQDRSAFLLFGHERLLDLCKHHILFDGGKKKIARYTQYFAIHKMLHRIEQKENLAQGTRRSGGVVWHTQGSGKSLTMVMFVRALIEHPSIQNPRIIIVTDRRDLDKQISETFRACNLKKEVYRTKTGEDLLEQIRNKNLNVVTTLVHKFDAAASKRAGFVDTDENIFVLIDEAHRTQSGKANMEMTRVIPNACYIAFTGTPLMKQERSTWKKFGGYIDKYTIDDALRDKVILPLIYEGRYVPLEQNDKQIDRSLERLFAPLPQEHRDQLQKYISKSLIKSVPARIFEIAFDVEKHYTKQFQGSGLKAQIVAPSKFAAILFQKYFEQTGKIKTAVVLSDETGIIEEEDEHKKEVSVYLDTLKEKYRSIDSYERDVIDSFKNQEEGVEIIIVVDKLLTGFDAPRNTVLYLTKDLKDHSLLQAIARVNRLHENEEKPKTAGFIIDYSENAKNLQIAMQLFSNFDPKDLGHVLIDVGDKVKELETAYHEVHDFFNGVDKSDTEALLASLEHEDKRVEFYEHVRDFIRVFNECLALQDFTQVFGKHIDQYQRELKSFAEIKKASVVRYADKVNLREYKGSLEKVLDTHITADEVELLTEQVNISDMAAFQKTLDTLGTDSAKAEAIAAQMERTIEEKLDTDPEFYERFSEKIENILKKMRDGKLADVQALGELKQVREQLLEKQDDTLPPEIVQKRGADVLYRNITRDASALSLAHTQWIELIVGIRNIITTQAIVDWQHNSETQRHMMSTVDDYVYDTVRVQWNIETTPEVLRSIMEESITLAKQNHELFGV